MNVPETPGPSTGWLTWERKTALIGIGAAVVTFPLAVLLAFSMWPVTHDVLDRTGIFALAFSWLAPMAAFLFFMFTRTARLFDTPEAEHVLAGLESERWKINAKIYQNSVEQGLLFLTAYLPLAAVVHPSDAHLLPILVCLWIFGRVTFYIGYHIHPAYRAFGFDYTLFPALLALAWFAITLVR